MTRDAFLPDYKLDEPVNLDADRLCDAANCGAAYGCEKCGCCPEHCCQRDVQPVADEVAEDVG